MKFDIQKNVALQGDQHVTLVEALLEIATLFKAVILKHWQRHVLRYTIMSERRTLARLSDRELEDIGIKRIDAIAESNRHFSDLPDNRVDWH